MRTVPAVIVGTVAHRIAARTSAETSDCSGCPDNQYCILGKPRLEPKETKGEPNEAKGKSSNVRTNDDRRKP